jgi:aminomethyltransferase
LLGEDGGILDDLMISRPSQSAKDGVLNLVVNAACKDADYALLAAGLPPEITLHRREHHALLALQGPLAAAVLGDISADVRAMAFMTTQTVTLDGIACEVSRSGYTGEDGYEISMPSDTVMALTERLCADERVQLIGLGARDSLRLEAGLCLYGHDLDPTTSPIEANLAWSIQKRRRIEGGFSGAARIQQELKSGPLRLRVGIKPEGRAPAREGTEILTVLGDRIGKITSGGFGPSVNGPVAMGYVLADCAAPGTRVNLMVRGKPLPAEIVPLPFIPHRYHKNKA